MPMSPRVSHSCQVSFPLSSQLYVEAEDDYLDRMEPRYDGSFELAACPDQVMPALLGFGESNC